MTEYYIAINGKQQGPFSIDELKKNKLERETLVWIKGMDEWEPAKNLTELKTFFVSPPPIPKTIDKKERNLSEVKTVVIPKTNLGDYSESGLIYVGIILIVLNVLVFVTDFLSLNVILIGGLIIRVSIAILASDSAKRQNRPPFGWAVFAFLFPPIAMIVQGSMRDKIID